jgi:hypothetical protein
MHGSTCIFWANLTSFSLKWELYVPAELGYGTRQRGKHIAPGPVHPRAAGSFSRRPVCFARRIAIGVRRGA